MEIQMSIVITEDLGNTTNTNDSKVSTIATLPFWKYWFMGEDYSNYYMYVLKVVLYSSLLHRSSTVVNVPLKGWIMVLKER